MAPSENTLTNRHSSSLLREWTHSSSCTRTVDSCGAAERRPPSARIGQEMKTPNREELVYLGQKNWVHQLKSPTSQSAMMGMTAAGR